MDNQAFNLSATKAKANQRSELTQHFIEQAKSWLIALCFVMVMIMVMVGLSHADNTAIKAQIDTVTGTGSWIQKMFAVGALVSGLMVMFVQKHIVLGVGIIGAVWGALAVYNSGVFN